MAPLPNHSVVPAGWAAHHRPVANGTMTALCDVHAPGTIEWPATELTPGERYATDVPARLQQLNAPREATPAGQEVTQQQYLVTMPLHLVPAAAQNITDSGPYVTVTGYMPGRAQDGDPHLVGRPLKVLAVQRGSLLWERDLICVDDLTNGGA